MASAGVGEPNGVIGIWNSITGERLAREEVQGWNVRSMALSPDNRTFALGAFTFAAFFGSLDDEPAQGIPDCWRAHDLVYSGDGLKLLVAGAFGSAANQSGARILDVSTRKYLGNLLYHHRDARTAVFSHDGRLVATSAFDRTVRLWDAKSGLPVSEPLAHAGVVERLEFSPDDLRLMAVGADRCIRVWHVRSGSGWSQMLPHGGEILDARFSSDGHSVVAVSKSGDIAVWDTRHAFSPTLSLHSSEPVVGLRLGERDSIHVAYRDGIRTRSRDLDREIGSLPAALLGARYHLETTAEGFLAAAMEGFTTFGASRGRQYVVPFNRARPAWWSVSMHSDRRRLVEVPLNSTNVSVFDIGSNQAIATFSAGFSMHSAAIRPGTSLLYGFGLHREVIVWDIDTRQVVASGNRRGADESVMEVIFSANGRKLQLRYGATMAPELYDPECILTGCQPETLNPTAGGAILSRDGMWVATGNWDRTVSICHGTSVQILPTEVDHGSIAGRLAFSDDNLFLATSGTEWSRLWLTANGEALTPPMLTDAPASYIEWSTIPPDGRSGWERPEVS